jgi:hypothetical protein
MALRRLAQGFQAGSPADDPALRADYALLLQFAGEWQRSGSLWR